MSYENWKNKAQGFQTVDVRHIQGSFFEGLKKRAEALEVGEGLHIIQTFEPHPLYAVMEGLGYEHHTEQRSEAEFHVWFCRVEKKEGDGSAPFKPLALLNYPMIDEKLGQIAVDFWETTWQSEKRVLPYETRLLLSLTNAVGAGRMRQAARELVKAYIHGVESAALDEPYRQKLMPRSTLTGEANLLVCPNVDAANIAYNLLKVAAGNNIALGPVLLGAAKPVCILTPSATVRRIVNMTAMTVARSTPAVQRFIPDETLRAAQPAAHIPDPTAVPEHLGVVPRPSAAAVRAGVLGHADGCGQDRADGRQARG